MTRATVGERFTETVHLTAEHIKRLGKVFKRAALKRGHRRIQIRIRRNDDDRHTRQFLFDVLKKLQPGWKILHCSK